MDPILYIGLMSGTSMDGVDAVLAAFNPSGSPHVLSRTQAVIPSDLRQELLALNQPGDNELHRANMAANALTRIYAQAVSDVLAQSGTSAGSVKAIGAHGQTVRHQPALGYTIQLNSPALLAELTGIDVVADFRSRDVAAGGQGAPLVPIFHHEVFGSERTRVILNLGGIANITVLRPGEVPLGCDTGPANLLLDLWCQAHTGSTYDQNGEWSLSGEPDPELLTHLIASEPWFADAPPKSTGRDLFHAQWLLSRLDAHTRNSPSTAANSGLRPQDVQATLRQLTARTIASCISQLAPDVVEVIACGGGVQNPALMEEIATAMPGVQILTTKVQGIDPQDVEALAFAWLAWAHQQKTAGNIPAVTGAAGPRVLGATWPANIRP
jgi:anhydro-N-acetylmuramic acid kinase